MSIKGPYETRMGLNEKVRAIRMARMQGPVVTVTGIVRATGLGKNTVKAALDSLVRESKATKNGHEYTMVEP